MKSDIYKEKNYNAWRNEIHFYLRLALEPAQRSTLTIKASVSAYELYRYYLCVPLFLYE